MKKYIIILIATLLTINTSSYLRADLIFDGGTFNVNSPSYFNGDVILMNNATVYINNVSFGNNGNLYVPQGSSFINYGLTYLWSNFISGSIAGNNSFYDGNLFFNQGSSINLPINSFVGNPYTNWNLFDAFGADLTPLSKNNPLTINLTGSSGKGNGGGSYSFDFMRLTNAIPDFDPSKWSVNTSQFALDSSLAGGSWSVSQQAYPQFMGGGQSSIISITYTIPEPSTYALFGIGAIGLLMVMRKKKMRKITLSTTTLVLVLTATVSASSSRINGNLLNGGTIILGDSSTTDISSLIIDGNLDLLTGSSIIFQINSSYSYGLIYLTGLNNISDTHLSYGGNLFINFSSYVPVPGNSFTFFSWADAVVQMNDFSAVTADSIPFTDSNGIWSAYDSTRGLSYQFNDSTGIFRVVPEPSTYGLFGIGAIGIMMVLRRKRTS